MAQLIDASGVIRFEGTISPSGFTSWHPAAADIGLGQVQGYVPCGGLPWGQYRIGGDHFAALFDHDTLTPWWLPTPLTITGFAFRVRIGGAGEAIRFALYEADNVWQPSALVWQSDEIDASVAALTTVAFPATLQGNYLAAFCSNAAYAGNGATLITAQGFFTVGLGLLQVGLDDDGSIGNNPFISVLRSRSYGAFPDPGGVWNDVNSIAGTFTDRDIQAFTALWATVA